MEDEKIVELYLARDTEAIQCTAHAYGARLRYLANSIVGDDRDAEECENDTYLRAWDSIPPNEPRTYLFAFLAKITRNLALDKYKRQTAAKRKAQIVSLSAEMEQCLPAVAETESMVQRDELCRSISEFLRMQSAEKRNLFLRRYWYMDSVAELSKRFAISESKVKTTLFRVRNELKEYLRKGGYMI